jgi:hypothetical protein
MTSRPAAWIAAAALTLVSDPLVPARAEGLSGSITALADYYPQSYQFPDQSGPGAQGSVLGTLEGFYRLSEMLNLDFKLRGSWTPQEQVTAFSDVEKAILQLKEGAWELRGGVLNERWGVMTVEQISDVVNQRDYVSNYRGRDRLGQPGLAFQYFGDSWSLTLIADTWKRSARLARGLDRFRNTALNYTDPKFEHGQWSPPDLGARLFKSIGDLELELTYFHGTARQPLLVPFIGSDGSVSLTPTYTDMDQGGVSARYVWGDYVLRGEGYVRAQDDTYGGAALGVERVFYRAFGGVQDLLVYLEGYYDTRPPDAPTTLFDNDIALGLRLNTNDAKGTELWLQTIYDLETSSNLLEFEAKRRITDSLVGKLELVAPINVKDDPALAGFERDTRLALSLTYFF